MLTHHDIWDAIDRLAHDHGLTPSGLARAAGLDPTTFNKSKRGGADGKPRWPSTESLAKVLEATSATFHTLVSYIPSAAPQQAAAVLSGAGACDQRGNQALPLVMLADVVAAVDRSGVLRPEIGADPQTDRLVFPALFEDTCFAIELADEQGLPLYRAGDRLLVAPVRIPTGGEGWNCAGSGLRVADRLLICCLSEDGLPELRLRTLRRMTAARLVVAPFDPAQPEETLEATALQWVARILWASQ